MFSYHVDFRHINIFNNYIFNLYYYVIFYIINLKKFNIYINSYTKILIEVYLLHYKFILNEKKTEIK